MTRGTERFNLFVLVLVAMMAAAIIVMLATRAEGGSLEPTNPPGSTFKTLDQVEPRIPISAAGLNITTSGSYYLTNNITSGGSGIGIRINADNVKLDLNGFALIGVAGATTGIAVQTPSRRNITITNGTIRNWPGAGIDAGFINGGEISHLFMHNNALGGIDGGTTGGSQILVHDNVLDVNGQPTGADGIRVASGIVRDNVITSSGRDGIRITVNAGAMVVSNVATFNGVSVAGAGIHVTNSAFNARVEDNVVASNDTGILVDSASASVVVRNAAHANTTNYNVAPTSVFGPEQTGATLAHPWANIVY